MREMAKTAAWSVNSCKPGNGVASLRDDTAYLESDIPKEQARYKIIFVHGFFCCRHDVLNVSQGLLQELGIYLLSFDRPGYCESDTHPARTEESISVDIAELTDNLQLGARFHLMGFSMGGEIMWSCLKHIPHRLSGVAILAPVGNYWWSGLPADVYEEAWYAQFPQDRIAVIITTRQRHRQGNIFTDKTEKRYNPNMSPVIRKDKWRKGSHVLWVMLIRKHAEVVVGDKHVFQVFRKHCKICKKAPRARIGSAPPPPGPPRASHPRASPVLLRPPCPSSPPTGSS
ncbi:uncharacterized protein LOC123428977 [Hordeum vulgare subsp. vulgare]|uniref:uncharacterized protein LOC123428977 n=1 Tax=Hordeum vulgare subsp. vulgare TaxID=112509 RepID=UPI001D1A4277|nr:uncharacterized protein LOC123428977 [Hordeum vulgare subsp. vulgare]